jgi:putative flippase GtrA
MYAIFGVLTTIINLVTYYVLYDKIHIANVISTALAWFISVIFAFITNKLFVFDSKSMEVKKVLYELVTFFTCRITTGLIDLVIMYIAVDLNHWNEMIWKLMSNIIVIILNYVASKLIIFKKDKNSDK